MVYTLINRIGFKNFNFYNFVNGRYVKAFLYDITALPCDCTGSPIVNKQCKYTITDNLKNVKNNKLWKLFSEC